MDIDYGLAAFVYLWTRDGKFPVNQETEDYIVGQLKAILKVEVSPEFSDVARAEMALRIIERSRQ